ncbi:ankyrin repeat domain-containing protein EMB506, chloroplastic isoform X2 [Mangifera indica]|uniref:ankyrin repeat domain-containing protein EMB506, chloroplastic isoform X2 n=1 Tax=Mangifera indica TaxID=29780 RepID=UPI001CFB5A5B|nr:ankyrin repeat domain-containing protein EMB506, chloroplastic isoform X2 [Mangifera indica]
MESTAAKNCFLHRLAGVVAVTMPAPSVGFFGTKMSKVSGSIRKRNVGLSVSGGNFINMRSFVVGSNQVASLQSQMGFWEEPDDGSDSDEEEEDEEMEENDLDFESDWEEERSGVGAAIRADVSATNQYEEELVKEVEQLLTPEQRELLQQNTTPNLGKITTGKWSLLHTFALSGQIHFMDKLLDNGFDIDTVDKDGLTALHKAIIGKKEAVISHLLRKGASPHVKDQVGAVQTVKLLIKYEVDVNVADNEGWTPLHIAIQSRNRDIAKVLLINGADKTRKTMDGKTALDMSLCYGKTFKSYDLAKLLKILPLERDL